MKKNPKKWWRSRGVQATLKAQTNAAKIGQALARVKGLVEKRATKRAPKAKRATKRALNAKKGQRRMKKIIPKGKLVWWRQSRFSVASARRV